MAATSSCLVVVVAAAAVCQLSLVLVVLQVSMGRKALSSEERLERKRL